MKTLIVNLILCLLTQVGCSQVILKIDNGFNTHSVKGEAIQLWEGKAYSYSGLLGVEYGHLCRNIITFSSQLGYIREGGKESFISPESDRHVEDWSYVHLNTTIRLQSREKTSLYIGVGPYVNIRAGEETFKRAYLYEGYDVDKVNYGVKTEIGFNHPFGERLQVGLNCTLLLPVSPMIHTDYVHDHLRSTGLYASVGYRLK
ncbi:hypothetical protein [Chitinophaga sancti]|uniref:hypothetical protein n=1 Tax=Chitinophaga sancti TaxID=1004 RepID=UPI003F7A77C1